jgi:hypothetical protein
LTAGTRTGRRSPLDTLNALPEPGLTAPLLPTVPPQPGHVPATFRNTHDDDPAGAGLGALSMAAVLAVAIAALRGTHTVLSTWWENRQARLAETAPLRESRLKHQAAMQGIADKAAQQRAKKVPSSHDFGRKTLGRTSSGGGRSSGGLGAGTGASKRSGAGSKSGSGSGSGLGGGGKKSSGASNSRSGSGKSSMKRGAGGGGSQGPGGKTRSPKSGSGGAGGSKGGGAGSRKQNQPGPGGSGGGSGRKTLAAAASKQAQKAAARRLKRRRKNNPPTPAVWSAGQQTGGGKNRKSPKGSGGPTSLTKNGRRNAPATRTPRTNRRAGRTTLTQAFTQSAQRAAERRWRRRNGRPGNPPIWTTPRNTSGNTGGAAGGPTTPNGPTATGPNTSTNARSRRGSGGARTSGSSWDRIRARLRNRYRRTNTSAPGATGPGNPGGNGGPTGRGRRRSPMENAGQTGGTTHTVERDDNVGDQARRWNPAAIGTGQPALPATGPAALDAAPTKPFPRPSTTRPKEARPMPPAKPDARLVKARHQAARTGHGVIADARHMDAQHATEITLDDAIDEYGDFKDDAFKTHDQCHKLADRAIKLRDTLLAFSEDLATNHNLIGALFTGAMARMAESMDLVARMAEEMKTSSLEAAEMAETADNDLNDAYRPYNTATADAGLSTPSAPIHNET